MKSTARIRSVQVQNIRHTSEKYFLLFCVCSYFNGRHLKELRHNLKFFSVTLKKSPKEILISVENTNNGPVLYEITDNGNGTVINTLILRPFQLQQK